MKEECWIAKVFATCGTTIPQEVSKMALRKLDSGAEVRFRHCGVFVNHCVFRHAVDDHNRLRHADLSLECTWKISHWENRVFAFMLAISEVNVFLAMRCFIWKREEQCTNILTLRQMLSGALVFNECLLKRKRTTARRTCHQQQQQQHEWVTAPLSASSFAGD